MIDEIKEHLQQVIIPFWLSLRDDTYGGYYGYMDFARRIDKQAVKGCILNSRILWFFANAYLLLGDKKLLDAARHGYEFMKQHCLDGEKGGVFWSVLYDGAPEDTSKHTYNQAFAIYALSAYYEASGDEESITTANAIFEIIETKCRDEGGYLEAFDRDFQLVENDKLSENGVMAGRTMNTLLHVFEAYTEFYRVTKQVRVKVRLEWILDTIEKRVYNPVLKRQEVFFDSGYRPLMDLHSYGHDIEAAWLIDRGLAVLGNPLYQERLGRITAALTKQVFETAFDGHSLSNECENGVVDTNRIWWVQAEGVVGFLNAYEKDRSHTEYLAAAAAVWNYIGRYMVDSRDGGEWYWRLDQNGVPDQDKPIVEPWKCPYHNGRMCMEVIRRKIDVA